MITIAGGVSTLVINYISLRPKLCSEYDWFCPTNNGSTPVMMSKYGVNLAETKKTTPLLRIDNKKDLPFGNSIVVISRNIGSRRQEQSVGCALRAAIGDIRLAKLDHACDRSTALFSITGKSMQTRR